MQTLRTPDDRFAGLPDFPYLPQFCDLDDGAPITGAMAPIFEREMVGAHGRAHPVIHDAGHFLQEDAGEELARHVVEFLRR